jgi:hypothetical protein
MISRSHVATPARMVSVSLPYSDITGDGGDLFLD